MYGGKQKAFDCHVCTKCANCFHNYCLAKVGEKVPKRNHDWLCPNCKIPATVSWHHETFINTCSSDNILTILLLHCRQHRELLNNMGSSDAEVALKSGLKLMLQNKIHKGKIVILEFFKTKLNLERDGTKYNCFGSEYEMCLKLFRHVWKLYMTLNCDSDYCAVVFWHGLRYFYDGLQSSDATQFRSLKPVEDFKLLLSPPY